MSSPSTTTANITTVEPEVLRQWITDNEDLVVLDVRSAAEFESVHIRGSYNVPLQLVSEHTDQLAERLGGRVVLVCQSGVRAEQARQRLGAAGVETAHVLTGGINSFADAGGDVVRGAQRWDIERQVRLVAGSLVVTGLLGGKFVSPKLRTVAGAIGAGLTFSGVTNTCAMGKALAAMPWNKTTQNLTAAESINQIPTTSA